MSKEAAVRAMREERYRRAAAGTPAASTPTRAAVRPPAPTVRSTAESLAAEPLTAGHRTPEDRDDNAPGDALCGHRSMNGRTCTREHGHAAKSHRYS